MYAVLFDHTPHTPPPPTPSTQHSTHRTTPQHKLDLHCQRACVAIVAVRETTVSAIRGLPEESVLQSDDLQSIADD